MAWVLDRPPSLAARVGVDESTGDDAGRSSVAAVVSVDSFVGGTIRHSEIPFGVGGLRLSATQVGWSAVVVGLSSNNGTAAMIAARALCQSGANDGVDCVRHAAPPVASRHSAHRPSVFDAGDVSTV